MKDGKIHNPIAATHSLIKYVSNMMKNCDTNLYKIDRRELAKYNHLYIIKILCLIKYYKLRHNMAVNRTFFVVPTLKK